MTFKPRAGELPLLEIIRDNETAATVLKPPRAAILASLRDPDSASGLARRLKLSRQRLSHHLREFETAGLVRLVEERRRRGCVERAFPRILGQYVRDEGVLDLPTAIHKMTGQPAAWYGQSDRGRLTDAFLADITVFDAGLVADRAEYTDPHHYPAGIIHVVVNGEPVLLDGEMTGQLPGRFLDRPTGE